MAFLIINNTGREQGPAKYYLGPPGIRGVLQGAVLQGYSPETLIKKAGLKSDSYTNVKAHIDGDQLQKLMSVIAEDMDDYFLGFMDQPSRMAMGLFMAGNYTHSKNLSESIDVMIESRLAVRNDINFERQIDAKHNEFTWGFTHQLKKGVDRRFFYWLRLMKVYHGFCWTVGEKIKLKRVGFSLAAPESDDLIDYSLFDCEVLFDQPLTTLTFDQKYLRLPVDHSTRALMDSIDFFGFPDESLSWSKRVESLVATLQDQQVFSPTIEQIAQKLPISARALRRQLARENETFQGIKNRLRQKLAIKFLLNTSNPITQIANQVGFAEPGGFTRAFIKWTGKTPSDYRAAFKH